MVTHGLVTKYLLGGSVSDTKIIPSPLVLQINTR